MISFLLIFTVWNDEFFVTCKCWLILCLFLCSMLRWCSTSFTRFRFIFFVHFLFYFSFSFFFLLFFDYSRFSFFISFFFSICICICVVHSFSLIFFSHVWQVCWRSYICIFCVCEMNGAQTRTMHKFVAVDAVHRTWLTLVQRTKLYPTIRQCSTVMK